MKFNLCFFPDDPIHASGIFGQGSFFNVFEAVNYKWSYSYCLVSQHCNFLRPYSVNGKLICEWWTEKDWEAVMA
jgi:hypothetical protein